MIYIKYFLHLPPTKMSSVCAIAYVCHRILWNNFTDVQQAICSFLTGGMLPAPPEANAGRPDNVNMMIKCLLFYIKLKFLNYH